MLQIPYFQAYPKLREYIFAALVAKTDFDFIALDKGDKTIREAVDALMTTMEEYGNWGFHFIEDKLIDNPNYFYNETAFMELFLSFAAVVNNEEDDELESLDDEQVEKEVVAPTTKIRTRWTTKEVKELTNFFKSGMSIDQLAQYFNHDENSVIEQLQKQELL